MSPFRRFVLPAVLASFVTGASQAQAPARPAVPPSPAASAPAAPAHPATAEQVREYLTLIRSAENAQAAFSQMQAVSRANAPAYLPADFWQDLEKTFASIDLIPSMVPVYQKYFSEEDMARIIAFYKTPAGKQLIANQPQAAAAAGDLMRKEANRVGQEVIARHKTEIEAAQKSAQPPPSLTSPPSSAPSSPTTPPAAPQQPH